MYGLGQIDPGSIVSGFAQGAEVGGVYGGLLDAGLTAGMQILSVLHIHPGATEANAITPVQNQLMANVDTITSMMTGGAAPTVLALQNGYYQMLTMIQQFKNFVLDRRFTDRRASGQALNTVMPYLDGSCGYAVPLGYSAVPTQQGQGCIAGVPGNWGPDGVLGALSQAIRALGGTVPTPQLTQGAAGMGVSLGYQFSGAPQLPQAGTVPYVTSPVVSNLQINRVSGPVSWNTLAPVAMLAAAYFMLRR